MVVRETVSKALARRPSPRLAECELTHIERGVIDAAAAERQHRAYVAALARRGVEVLVLPPLAGYPDSCFVEDVLLAFPECFVATRPGADSRQGEVDEIVASVPRDRPLLRLPAQARLDGGDVLRIGRKVFVGRTTRTNAAAVEALANLAGPYGYAVQAVQCDHALHLKTAVAEIDGSTVLIDRRRLDAAAFAGFALIEADPDEAFAGNCLSVNGRVLMQTAHASTARRVRAAGFDVDLVDVSEFAKAEAGLTCLSVLVPDAR